ncbi:MAG: sigma 54-interacting transcriptional regulator [Polyangiaceae bacterium]
MAATRSFASDDSSPEPSPDAFRLLVVERSSSRVVHLPSAGFVVIGRDPEADIRVDDPAASRRHARLQISGGAVRLIDSGSRNGLSVNGARIDGACDLAPGDVVSLGDVTLILRGGKRTAVRRALLGAQELHARLQIEIDRALDLGRPLSIAVISLGPRISPPSGERAGAGQDMESALTPHLTALDVAGRLPDGAIAIAFGEKRADEARAAASLLLDQLARGWPTCRAGVASCPEDGCDAATLLGLARDAAEANAPVREQGPSFAPMDRVRAAQEAVPVTVDLGDRAIVMADPSMVSLFGLIGRLAAASITVLLSGETGVGKENAAFAVHHGSPRRTGPFVAVNCAAIPDTLVEGELFGFARGAFSGAHAPKAGLFERADGGTLFLDEVGELSLAAQAKLLRALEGGRFLRLGETTEREADVRIVAATNRDLAAEVRAHRFREDLYYRFGSAVVHIPPLRDRPADIPVLARTFLASARARAGKGALAIGASAMLALSRYSWPGNVRELKNAMDYVAASVDHGIVERAHLPSAVAAATAELRRDSDRPSSLRAFDGAVPAAASSMDRTPSTEPPPGADPLSDPRPPAVFLPLHEEIEALERRRIREALAACGGIKTRAARLIGVPERTFRLKLRQYGFS